MIGSCSDSSSACPSNGADTNVNIYLTYDHRSTANVSERKLMVIVSESQSTNKPAVQVFPMQLWDKMAAVRSLNTSGGATLGDIYATKLAIYNGSGASSQQLSDPLGD